MDVLHGVVDWIPYLIDPRGLIFTGVIGGLVWLVSDDSPPYQYEPIKSLPKPAVVSRTRFNNPTSNGRVRSNPIAASPPAFNSTAARVGELAKPTIAQNLYALVLPILIVIVIYRYLCKPRPTKDTKDEDEPVVAGTPILGKSEGNLVDKETGETQGQEKTAENQVQPIQENNLTHATDNSQKKSPNNLNEITQVDYKKEIEMKAMNERLVAENEKLKTELAAKDAESRRLKGEKDLETTQKAAELDGAQVSNSTDGSDSSPPKKRNKEQGHAEAAPPKTDKRQDQEKKDDQAQGVEQYETSSEQIQAPEQENNTEPQKQPLAPSKDAIEQTPVDSAGAPRPQQASPAGVPKSPSSSQPPNASPKSP